jgi:hypothetical protein
MADAPLSIVPGGKGKDTARERAFVDSPQDSSGCGNYSLSMTEMTPLPGAGSPAGRPAAIDRAAVPPDGVVIAHVEVPQDFEAGRVRAQLLQEHPDGEHDRIARQRTSRGHPSFLYRPRWFR